MILALISLVDINNAWDLIKAIYEFDKELIDEFRRAIKLKIKIIFYFNLTKSLINRK
jgi:hypothetical protein